MRGSFFENVNAQVAIVPIDLATGANNGDWVNMENVERLVVLVLADAGTAGEDPVVTLNQATSNAGAGSKALNFTKVYEKVGAQASTGTYTKVTQAAANTYTNAAAGEAENLFGIEILPEMLDVAGGFTHVQVAIPDTGATAGKIGCALYLAFMKRAEDAVGTVID